MSHIVGKLAGHYYYDRLQRPPEQLYHLTIHPDQGTVAQWASNWQWGKITLAGGSATFEGSRCHGRQRQLDDGPRSLTMNSTFGNWSVYATPVRLTGSTLACLCPRARPERDGGRRRGDGTRPVRAPASPEDTSTASETARSLIVFACVFGGALVGFLLRGKLPAHHLGSNQGCRYARDGTAGDDGRLGAQPPDRLGRRSSYDAQSNEMTRLAANVVVLDRVLANDGPQSKGARDVLRRVVIRVLDQMWPKTGRGSATLDLGPTGIEGLYHDIQALSPQTEAQRALRADALQISIDLGRTRALLSTQAGSTIPLPFLVIMTFWLTVIFASFALFAPGNATVLTMLFVCALSVSGAVFLLLELDRPFHGFVQVSSTPLESALAYLGR